MLRNFTNATNIKKLTFPMVCRKELFLICFNVMTYGNHIELGDPVFLHRERQRDTVFFDEHGWRGRLAPPIWLFDTRSCFSTWLLLKQNNNISRNIILSINKTRNPKESHNLLFALRTRDLKDEIKITYYLAKNVCKYLVLIVLTEYIFHI